MQRTERDFDSHGRRHLFVEYRRHHSYDNNKPDDDHLLHCNGNEWSGMFCFCYNYGNGQSFTCCQCRHSSNDMQRTERDFDSHGRWHLFVEHGRYHSHHHGKPDCYYHLYSNSNEFKWLYSDSQ